MLSWVKFAFAQFQAGERMRIIELTDTITLDSLSIIPGSFSLTCNGNEVDTSLYTLHWPSAFLTIRLDRWFTSGMPEAPLEVRYRTFAYNLTTKTFDPIKQSLITTQQQKPSTPVIYDTKEIIRRDDLFHMDGITKSGSLTRGVSFGNTQDATVVSAFNLQLSGKLNNDVEILAAITDENIPVQPDGNTQQLQDFDKIFIQLSKGSTKVIGGDFFITKPKGYFLNVFKRAQGLSVSTGFPNRNIFKKEVEGSMRVGASGAVARGKFRRQEFMGMEGNQGPYRLTGNEGELFVIVLSGSESVFVDGIKMERGQENDYIIDYNTAELTFTANRLITKDSRIVVEYEYSDRNYQRWMIHTNNEWEYKNFSYRLNFFTEFDDRNAPLNQTLSDTQKVILSQVGDQINQAFSPAIDSVGFNTNEVLYKKIDTLVNSQIYTIYVYSTHPDSAFYRLIFTKLGAGNGNYVLLPSTVNGRVYGWVAPNPDGTKNGEYEPVVKLITPKSHRLLTFGTTYKPSRKWELDAEGALSHNDLNTFSSLDNQDDLGYAFRVQARYQTPLNKKEKDTLRLDTRISYEQVSEFFKPAIRFRSVEFDRDWNFVNRNNPNLIVQNNFIGTDYIPQLSVEITQPSWGRLGYSGGVYLKGVTYQAFRNGIQADVLKKRWELKYQGSQTATYDSLSRSLFLRQRLFTATHFTFLSLGIQGETEYNAFFNRFTDSLLRSSYMFNDWELFIQQGKASEHRWRVFYRNRIDHLADTSGILKYAAIAHHTGGAFELNPTEHHFLKVGLSWRYLQVVDTLLLRKPSENTLLSRIEYNGKYAKGAIQLNLFYEAGSGLENRRDFQFVVSLNGLGTHVWIDYNNDGIKQRDEYEIRTGTVVGTDGLTYIKFFVPTTEFIRTFYNQFTASLQIQAPQDWKKQGGWKKFLARISSQTVFRSDRKTQQDNWAASFNPFVTDPQDTSLISLNHSLRQTLYFNRFDSKFGTEFNYQDIQNRQLLSNGIDARTNRYGSLRLRWNIVRMLTLNLDARTGRKTFDSQFLRNRNYTIRYHELMPEVVIQPGNTFRAGITYRLAFKDNLGTPGDTLLPGGESARMHDWGVDIKTNFIAKGQLQVRSNLIWISYNGAQNTALAFEMLESLRSGINVTWGASFQRTIGNNLQLTLQYDGRKSEGANFVHIASMQLRAFF